MNSIKRTIFTAGAMLGLTASSAFAYSTLHVIGPSDFVGPFTIRGPVAPPVSGYGGGFKSTLDGSVQMMFCVDFANDVSIPSTTSVDVSSFSNLSNTRFGATPAPTFIYGSYSALERYEMAAFLVTQYSFFGSPLPSSNAFFGDTNNRGVQSAIWTLLDATGENYNAPSGSQTGNVGTWLTTADSWLHGASDKSFLSNFRIVSDASFASLGYPGRLNVGIQEFLTYSTPEASYSGFLAFGLLGLILFAWRQRRVRAATVRSAE